MLAGFDWVLEHYDDPRYNIKVINNSWGPGAGHPFDPSEPVQRAISAAHDAGLAVVFGAGNDGPKTGTLNAFSANPKAISAAAGTKAGHIALFSSRGVPGSPLWQPTVTAPGQFIASVRARTGFSAAIADATGADPSEPILPPDNLSYAYASGTSMAAPHISGVIALMQEAAIRRLDRYLTPAEIRNVLQRTAVSGDPARGPGGLPGYQGYAMGAGYADALAAVRAVAAGQLGAYDSGTIADTRTFRGQVSVSALLVTSSFETTFVVAPGAISLDVMIDWSAAAQDIDLFDPTGALRGSTTLRCQASEGPNQYSSFCSTLPNERINVASPEPGSWRAVVHGTVSVAETVNGMWSAVYPAGTSLTAAPPAASVSIAAPALPALAGQALAVTATVRDAAGNPVANALVSWSSSGIGTLAFGETCNLQPAPRNRFCSSGIGTLAFGETLTDERGTAEAGLRSDVPGTQTVIASSGSVSGSAAATWLGLALPDLLAPPSTPGKASGGGHFDDPGKRHFGFYAEYSTAAAAPGGDLSFDDKAGTQVEAASVDRLTINGSSATVTGKATLNGSTGYRYRVEAVDNAEPGRNADTFRLIVTRDLDPLFRYETSGMLGGGNIQVAAE